MRKLLTMLLVLLLPLTALADGPEAFSDALQSMTDADFAAACEAALEGTTLQGSTMAECGVARTAWAAFAVMYRPDGLMMLCCFIPQGDGMALDWHNDLLLSYYQDVSFKGGRALWAGGAVPHLSASLFNLDIRIEPGDGTRLCLTCDGDSYTGWRVTDMQLYLLHGDAPALALHLPKDCLAEDIYLATCAPDDWRRGETEEEYHGW